MTTSFNITRRTGLIGGAALTLSLTGALRASECVTGEVDTVASVSSGHSLTLASGLKVRLSGIVAPSWEDPFGNEARNALRNRVQGRRVRLSYGGDPRDRYDRALAQVHTLDPSGNEDVWLQAELVRLGLARVYTWPDEKIDPASLYAAEITARQQVQGLWADPVYAVRGPEPNALAQDVDSLQLVEGIVTSTADVRGRAYLNFGADYRSDFTVAVAKKHRRRFKAVDPVSLEGARVRVRGWIELTNGPMIWASHPARIEILS